MGQKKLTDLTIKDNFLFGAVMMEEKNCQDLLEMVLGFPIEHVEISKEKSIVYHPEYKGVRLDIYARDQKHTCYNVEMQAVSKPSLGKRSRYYHSQMDMEALLGGTEYTELPPAYVIFICDFDPFGKGKYQYTFCNACEESDKAQLGDESYTIFLSTKGRNERDVSKSLVSFLKFVSADHQKSKEKSEDPFVRQIQETIEKIQYDREMRERFMIFQEMLNEERIAGMQEGEKKAKKETIVKIVKKLGVFPEQMQKRIEEETESKVLDILLEKAIEADTIERFCLEADELFHSKKES